MTPTTGTMSATIPATVVYCARAERRLAALSRPARAVL